MGIEVAGFRQTDSKYPGEGGEEGEEGGKLLG